MIFNFEEGILLMVLNSQRNIISNFDDGHLIRYGNDCNNYVYGDILYSIHNALQRNHCLHSQTLFILMCHNHDENVDSTKAIKLLHRKANPNHIFYIKSKNKFFSSEMIKIAELGVHLFDFQTKINIGENLNFKSFESTAEFKDYIDAALSYVKHNIINAIAIEYDERDKDYVEKDLNLYKQKYSFLRIKNAENHFEVNPI